MQRKFSFSRNQERADGEGLAAAGEDLADGEGLVAGMAEEEQDRQRRLVWQPRVRIEVLRLEQGLVWHLGMEVLGMEHDMEHDMEQEDGEEDGVFTVVGIGVLRFWRP